MSLWGGFWILLGWRVGMTPKERLWQALNGILVWDPKDNDVVVVPKADLEKVLQHLGDLEDRIYYATGTLNGS